MKVRRTFTGKYLVAFGMALAAGRDRQATRELIVELEGAGMAREEIVEQLKTRLKSQIGFEGE